MDTRKLVETTGCAAFVSDENGVIGAWNKAAEKLMGRTAEEVIGKTCAETIAGTDVFGNRFCTEGCAIQRMVQNGEAVHNFQFDVRTAAGETFLAGMCTLVIHGAEEERYSMVHLFQPIAPGRSGIGRIVRAASAGAEATPQLKPGTSLTAREREVLSLLEAGVPTQAMADSMKISVTTVRNHIQGILRKLGAHSRLEAVSTARRQGLV
jgi:PAS domain S-box-containing protein